MDREALSLLSAGTVNYQLSSRSQIRPDNVAYLLSGCSDAAISLAMVVDLGMAGNTGELWSHAMAELSQRADIQRFRSKKNELLVRLIHLGILEITRSGACDTCGGRKEIKSGDKYIKCKNCCGYGRGRVTDRERARLLNIPESTYRYEIKRIYREIWIWFSARNTEIEIACRENSRAA